MSDNKEIPAPLGAQIRSLRTGRGWSLAELARRAGTSAPTLHRYENGWDSFELGTLRKIASALGASLDVRLVSRQAVGERTDTTSRARAARHLRSLFWDRPLSARDLDEFPDWVLGRVLCFGNRRQVSEARIYYGDDALRRAVSRRGIDPRTRNYWKLILGDAGAP